VIKLAIRLAIVALLANGTWRVGTVYAQHYRFKDAVTQTTQFRGSKSDEQIRERIFELAATYDIPLGDDSLTVTQRDNHTIVDCSYKRAIELFPGITYAWPFTVHVDTFIIKPRASLIPRYDGSPGVPGFSAPFGVRPHEMSGSDPSQARNAASAASAKVLAVWASRSASAAV
jgi:hypothetical protein